VKLEKLIARLEDVTKRLEASGSGSGSGSSGSAGSGASGEGSPKIAAFDALVAEFIPKWLEVSQKLGGDTATLSAIVGEAVQALRQVLLTAASCKKPAEGDLAGVLKPLSDKMSEINAFRDKKRGTKEFDHLSTLSEGITAFGWVTVSPTPEPFAVQARGGSEFYSNKLLNLYKGKDETQMEWIRGFNGFLKGIEKFIKENHRTGLEWTGKDDAKSFVAGGGAKPSAGVTADAASKKAAVPTPSKSAADAPVATNVMKELSKGLDVTAGLKKVDKSEMTHKNPALRAGGVVVAKDDASKVSAAKKGMPTGTAKFALVGNKWTVEFQDGNKTIVIDKPEIKHTVYIYGCFDSVIQIKGKVNQITLDSCRKTSVVCTDVLSSVDLVNNSGVQVQCTGTCATFSVEKVSGCQLYLSPGCLKAEIITSKSDSVNVHIPKGEEFIEKPIPEQFKSVINDKLELITEHVEHSGG